MKTCPKCNRTFPDEGQKFCTFDGGLLIAPQTFDPNATIRATSIDLNSASERPTSRDLPDPNATMIESYPATVALPRNTGPTGQPTTVSSADTADFSRPAAPPPPPPVSPPPPPPTVAAPPPPPPVSEPLPNVPTGPVAAAQPVAPPTGTTGPVVQQAPSTPLPPQAAPKKKSKLPWIILGVLVFLLLSGGVLAAAFFFIVKPKLDDMSARNPPVVVESNTNTATPAPTIAQASPSPSATPEDTFVPPPGAVQFTNSKDKLDGALAQHYFDFNFYYLNNWQSDPKAGVSGAANFVKVERRIPPDFTQENFVVRWYQSTGTFANDLPNYPKLVEDFSASLAKTFSAYEYRKVSEGPTKVNSMDAYEFRWDGLSKGTEKGDLRLWGRVIFLPTGNNGDSNGAILSMFTTSLAPELSSVEDVGERGEAKVILDSFRFGKKN
jgi:hypothetical protein